MARLRSHRDALHRRRIRVPAAMSSALWILLLLASASLSSLHTHAVVVDDHRHDSYASSDGAPTVSAEESPVPIGSGSQSGPIACELCNLGRRSDSEVAILPEALIWALDAPSTMPARQAASEHPRTLVPASSAPRAPPTFSA